MAVHKIQNKLFSVEVNSFGAELCSVLSKETGIEYIWQADETIWARHAPNLFPIVGKLKDGEFLYQSKTYKLPQHGFARDNEFTCVDQTEDYLLFELTASEHTLQHYPFHFKLQIGYKLNGNKVETRYSIFNPDNNDLYFSVGAHPAFNCPLQENESFNDYDLIFPNKNDLTVNTLNDGLIASQTKKIELHNSKLNVSKQLFDNDALVFMNTQIDEVQLVSRKTKHGVTLISKNWPYFGIWTKKDTEQFVCLEPWQGIADSDISNSNFVEKTGIIKLAAKQHYNCFFDLLFF
jgi:galactose mutarotase-like enzyme